jgi:metal-responsive CopG/Arc/MetJ family transcriptional regulator
MREVISVSLTKDLKEKLEKFSKSLENSKSEIVKQALRQFFAKEEFKNLRGKMIPEAKKRGIYTDEDVFEKIS